MPHDSNALIAQLRGTLTQGRYNPEVVHHYCRSARRFLSHLAERKIALEAVTPADVSNYLRITIRRFRTRHGYLSFVEQDNLSADRNLRTVAARAESLASRTCHH
jgi:hypothetical protein